jgi:hypothetical protein
MSDAATAVSGNLNRSLVKPAWIVMIVGWLLMFIPFPGTGIIGIIIAGIGGAILGIVNLVRGVVPAGIAQIVCAFVVTPIVYLITLAIFGAALLSM